jgi:choline dehydrogenase-like flavoprotein
MKRNAPREADFVVVGAGSAGSIVAAQLAGAGASVILVEAGGTDRRPDVRLPFGIVSLYATANWRYPTAPDPSKNSAGGAFASGRIVGGSGSINAMVFVRGRPSDYDEWADLGAVGWEFNSVLPHFKSIENWVGGPDEYRGAAGPVAVSWCGHHHPLDDAFIEAAVEAGHDRNPDPNGRTQLGVARSQVNQSRGLRCSSAKGFLRGLPEVSRPYLLTKTKATRILVTDGRATGVECEGQTLRARQEVILCAGAIGSPALLLRSGIGPGLSVVDLPGVGENLQDHLVVTQHWKSKVPTINTIGPLGAVRAVGSLAIKGTGALTTTPFEAQLFTDEFQIARRRQSAHSTIRLIIMLRPPGPTRCLRPWSMNTSPTAHLLAAAVVRSGPSAVREKLVGPPRNLLAVASAPVDRPHRQDGFRGQPRSLDASLA